MSNIDNTPNSAKVSPKVTVASLGSAVAVLVLYALSLIPAVGELPTTVAGAVTVLVVGGVTFLAGYVRRDPDRT